MNLWEGETSKTVKFGEKGKDDEKKVYCMSAAEDFVYAVNKSDLNDIKKAPGDLRDKKIARFKTDDAEKITLTHGKETIVIAKKDDKWKITEPSEMKTDEDDVKDMLKKITEAENKSF